MKTVRILRRNRRPALPLCCSSSLPTSWSPRAIHSRRSYHAAAKHGVCQYGRVHQQCGLSRRLWLWLREESVVCHLSVGPHPTTGRLTWSPTLIGSVTRRLVFLNGALVIGLVAQSSIHAFFNERYSSVDLYSICCFSRSLLPPFAILLQHGSPHFDSASDG